MKLILLLLLAPSHFIYWPNNPNLNVFYNYQEKRKIIKSELLEAEKPKIRT